jgi:hypothetical protein
MYSIQFVQMMENAGRYLADTAVQRFPDQDPSRKIWSKLMFRTSAAMIAWGYFVR